MAPARFRLSTAPALAALAAPASPSAPAIDIAATTASGDEALALAPNVLSVRHWNRLLGGLLYAATPRVDSATLMRRSFAVDVLQCPTCGGRLRVRGDITEPTLVRQVLERLGVPSEAPPVARARHPTLLFAADETAD